MRFENESQRSAAAIRARADGEQEALAGVGDVGPTPDEPARIAAERALRESVGRVMGAVEVPAGLRDGVLRRLRADHRREVVAGRVRAAAMAAALVLSVAGVWLAARQATQGTAGPDLGAATASVALREHARTVSNPIYAVKTRAPVEALREVEGLCRQRLGRGLDAERLSVLGEFQGVSVCRFPTGEEAVHLRFVARAACGHGEPLSVFVQRDTGRIPVATGRGVVELRCGESGRSVTVWCADGLMYLIVSDDAELVRCVVRAIGGRN